MAELRTLVMVRGKPRFNMVGQRLPDSLHDTEEAISLGLAKRLQKYALKRLSEAGFNVSTWDCEVYTMDGDERPADRYYVVNFTNERGGSIGIQGIMTLHGWPTLDHGLCIDEDRTNG